MKDLFSKMKVSLSLLTAALVFSGFSASYTTLQAEDAQDQEKIEAPAPSDEAPEGTEGEDTEPDKPKDHPAH